jgi:hypothetical protein
MPYVIAKSDPTKPLITIPDNSVNITDTSLTLIGKNYPNYGQAFATNFLHLVENFSNSTAPINPTAGQLWFNNTTLTLSVFDGLNWNAVNSFNSSTISSLPRETVASGDAFLAVSDNGNALSISKTDFLSDVSTPQTGMIIIWPSSSIPAPSGWLFCDGSSYYRYNYPTLYSVIGVNYGSAAIDYFNVPQIAGLPVSNGSLTYQSTSTTYIIKT